MSASANSQNDRQQQQPTAARRSSCGSSCFNNGTNHNRLSVYPLAFDCRRSQRQLSATGSFADQQVDHADADDVTTAAVLAGNLDNLPPVPSRTVCVFISSTFSDMAPERNALMERVYPQLKEFCRQQYRLEFQMLDLRWGIREQSHNDHTIIEFCLSEIDKCKAKSVGPNFVALIGQKYGYRPFPPTIAADEFETIREDIASCEDRQVAAAATLLDKWFKKNTNVLPHVYTLQPISSVIPDYAHNDDVTRKQLAEEKWQVVYNQLRQLLRQGVTSCVENGKLAAFCKDHYFVSVTEYEIARGMLGDPVNCNASSLCFMRNINNLERNACHARARNYIDLIAADQTPTGPATPVTGTTAAVTAAARSSLPAVDLEAQRLLSDLREKVTRVLTDERNVEYLEFDWNQDKDCNPSDDEQYLKLFCDSFRDKMQWLISRAAERTTSIASSSDSSHHGGTAAAAEAATNNCTGVVGCMQLKVVEIVQHLTMCRDRSREFRGRHAALSHIRHYLQLQQQQQQHQRQSNTTSSIQDAPQMTADQPIVVFGESGSGKTSVLAKVASMSSQWLRVSAAVQPVVVIRFIGTTSLSCNIRLLLSSICWQIASAYRLSTSQLPSDYPSLVTFFHGLLHVATASRPLVLILDGLDQLGSAHRAQNLAWLPTVLPTSVRLVLSTLQSDKHELLETLRALLTCSSENFVRITPLGAQLSVDVVKDRLQSVNRTLTAAQLAVVERALSECSLPLYTSLVFEEVCQWASYQNVAETVLQPTVDEIINTFFDRLERYHGKVFLSHTLSYLTASRNGLSYAELEDILSLDDTVLNDVFQHWLPPLRRIPPLLIPRLLDELGRYLVQREANGARVIYWYHGQFIAVVRRRYLADSEERRRLIHSTLAHYYLGTWASGRRKPFRYSNRQLRCLSGGRTKGKPRKLDDEADRMVAQQPLYFGQEVNYSGLNAGKKQLRYNMRKLSELPYHLIESGLFAELRSHVLFNYDWLHAKLSATSLPDVLADFQMTTMSTDLMQSRASDLVNASDMKLLAGALSVGGAHLSHNPDTLAFDLLGRLLFYYADNDDGGRTVPTTAVDSDDNDETQVMRRINEETRLLMTAGIKTLLQQCDVRSVRHSALLPVLQCFDPPTAMSLYNLEGHSQVVSDVVFSPATNELISVSKDGTLVFWDLSSGERTRCLDVSAVQPGRTTRLYVADARFLVVDFDTPDSLAHVYDVKTGRLLHACAQPRLTSPLRGFVAGCLLCRQKSLVDLRTGVELTTLDEFIESKSFVVCAVTPNERFLLVGEPAEVRLFDLQQLQTSSASTVATSASTWNEVGTPPMIRENSSGSSGPGLLYRRKPVVSFSASNQLSAVAISSDSRLAFVGQSFDCVFSVLDIDPASEDFGQVVIKVDCSQYASLSFTRSAAASPASTVYTDRFDSSEQRRPNEISEISLSSVPFTGAVRVLLNVCRFRLAVLTLSLELTRNYVCCSLDVPADAVSSAVVLQSSSFSHDGQLVLASVDSSLLVWSTDTCQLIHNINLHTTYGYSLSVHSDRNLVATGSTIHTAVMVWDLDNAQTTETPDLKVYAGPVDCVSVACDVRLIFVKSHYGLASSNRSYRYLGSFGVDVWNLSTGSWTPVLPFRKYGRLLQMSVSSDAELLALLLVNDTQDHYVMVFEIESRSGLHVATRWSVEDIRCVAAHARCSSFVVSPSWDFMATVSTRRRRSSSCPAADTTTEPTDGNVQLWDINTGQSVVNFQEATSPVFTLDGSNLLYIDQGLAVIAYSLTDLAPKYRISDCCRQVDQLTALPVFHQRFLSTQLEVTDVTDVNQQCAVVSIYEDRALLREMRVASGGLLDVSKDGRLAVDGLLQVYDLETGTMVASFRSQITTSVANVSDSLSVDVTLKLVRLTADGRYVVWVDGVEVRVGRVGDELVVARTSTHERVTSLETMEHGYVLVVGRKDGHLLTMRLVVDMADKDDIQQQQQQQQQRCSDVQERLQLLLNRQGCSHESLLKLDDIYRQRPKSKSDRQLPVASEYVISNMLRHADVPHSVITTSTNGNSGSHRGGHDSRRRVASTPDSPWKANQKSGGSPSSEVATSASVVSNHLRLPPEFNHHLHSARSATPSPTTNRRDAITVRAATLSWASRLSPAALRRKPLTRSALTLMDSLRRSESALDSQTLAIATFNSLHKSSTLPKSESYGTLLDEVELSRLTLDGDDVTGNCEEQTTGKHCRPPSKKKRFKNLFKLSAAKKCFGCSSSPSSSSESNSKPPTGQRK